MAVLVTFSSVTPLTEVTNLAINVPVSTNIRLRVLPELGNDVNGGSSLQAARPILEAMVDVNGSVLPQFARLYKVSKDGNELAGTEVPLSVELLSSPFANGLPTKEVYFDLLFNPIEELDGLTAYAFDYVNVLPGEWQDKSKLVYGSSLGNLS